MDDLLLVKSLQSQDHLIKNRPDILLLGELGSFLCVVYLCLEVAIVAVFHYNAETLGGLFKKGLFIGSDVRVVD
jgi:hypothetical protein